MPRVCVMCGASKGKKKYTKGQWRRSDKESVCRKCRANQDLKEVPPPPAIKTSTPPPKKKRRVRNKRFHALTPTDEGTGRDVNDQRSRCSRSFGNGNNSPIVDVPTVIQKVGKVACKIFGHISKEDLDSLQREIEEKTLLFSNIRFNVIYSYFIFYLHH